MENKVIDLQEFNMSDEELFSYVDNNKLESEKSPRPDIPIGSLCSEYF